MISAKSIAKRSARVFLRVFPPCSMISQAIAYNLFLAFFPTLLLIVAQRYVAAGVTARCVLFDPATNGDAEIINHRDHRESLS